MKRIIIVGKAGSGKDYLRDGLIKAGYRADVSLTTRPKRWGEIDNVTYKYVTNDQFEEYSVQNLFSETVHFNGWHYGTLQKSWLQSQVFIRSPSGIKQITSEERKSCFIVYLDIDPIIREARLLTRSDADSASRRMAADNRDFDQFTDFDMKITDCFFTLETTIKQIAAKVHLFHLSNTSS